MNGKKEQPPKREPNHSTRYQNDLFPESAFPEDAFPEDVFPSDLFPRQKPKYPSRD